MTFHFYTSHIKYVKQGQQFLKTGVTTISVTTVAFHLQKKYFQQAIIDVAVLLQLLHREDILQYYFF